MADSEHFPDQRQGKRLVVLIGSAREANLVIFALAFVEYVACRQQVNNST